VPPGWYADGVFAYRVDYEAFVAWSTFAAVVLALAQSLKSAVDVRRQRQYETWLREKQVEEEYLRRMLEVIDTPLSAAQQFFFAASRVLAAMPGGFFGGRVGGLFGDDSEEERLRVRIQDEELETQLNTELRQRMDAFATEADRHASVLGNYIDIFGALREAARQRRDESAAADYDELLRTMVAASDATGNLAAWLSDEQNVSATMPDEFERLELVAVARKTTFEASRAIARRIVRLYQSPPAG